MPVTCADNFLNEHRHVLVVIQQIARLPVRDGVCVQGAGIDFRDGLQEFPQARLEVTLVGQENAAVFARERRAEAVFQKTRRADDQRVGADFLQHRP